MATVSVGMSFLAFSAFAMSSLISGYILCTRRNSVWISLLYFLLWPNAFQKLLMLVIFSLYRRDFVYIQFQYIVHLIRGGWRSRISLSCFHSKFQIHTLFNDNCFGVENVSRPCRRCVWSWLGCLYGQWVI
jgi:hypothetical protein